MYIKTINMIKIIKNELNLNLKIMITVVLYNSTVGIVPLFEYRTTSFTDASQIQVSLE